MLQWFKTAATKTFKAVKTVVTGTVTVVLVISRLASSAGSSMFPIPKFVQLLTNIENPYKHPATMPLALAAVFFNLFINLAVRVPNMLKQFFPMPKPAIDLERNVNVMDDYDDEPLPEPVPSKCACCQSSTCCKCFEGMGLVGGAFFTLSTVVSLYSGFSSSFSSINGAFAFDELLENLINGEVDEAMWKEYLVFGIGMTYFVANFYSFLRNNYVSINRNAKEAALAISNGQIPRNKNVFGTLLLAGASVIAPGFLARFSTQATLENLEKTLKKLFDIKFNSLLKTIMIDTSPISATFTNALTYLPAVYRVFSKERIVYENERKWEGPATKVVFGVGILDAIITAISNITGQAKTLIAHGYNWKSPAALTVNIFFSSSTALANLFFTSKEGFENTLRTFHEYKGEQPYKGVPQIEQESTASQVIKVYPATNKSPFLFFNNDADSTNARNNINSMELEEKERMVAFDEIVEVKPKRMCC